MTTISLPARPTTPPCPRCGGRTFDNRRAKRSARAADYLCESAHCGAAIWPADPVDQLLAELFARPMGGQVVCHA